MKNSYFKISIFFALVGILIVSCKKNTANVSLEPSVWLERSDRTDTIVFTNGLLVLNRPKEVRNGYLLPKLGAGPYSFKELKDSIGLQYALSSLWAPKNYTFKVERNKLYIGDFYQKGSGKVLVFDKLR